MAMNSLAVLLAVEALGGNVDQAAADLARFTPPTGRGERSFLRTPAGDFTLVDESYNANPASMRAALNLLRETQVGGRRIAVLGDMLELGSQAADLHADLAEAIVSSDVDLVFAAGPLMKHLYDALPEAMRGAWAPTSSEIEDALVAAIGVYDIVMVKGSNGSRMGPVVAKLKSLFAQRDADLTVEG
jgi:UDP-N-acetylmuramoyl-tripeptide--D-alanyl-D-alanine ligase